MYIASASPCEDLNLAGSVCHDVLQWGSTLLLAQLDHLRGEGSSEDFGRQFQEARREKSKTCKENRGDTLWSLTGALDEWWCGCYSC